jgi:hypothetical protein
LPGTDQEAAWNALIYTICGFFDKWDDSEEMLTITGFVPFFYADSCAEGGEQYIILDGQSENALHLEEACRFRLTHGKLDFVERVFATRSAEFLSILAKAAQMFGRSLYEIREREAFCIELERDFSVCPTSADLRESVMGMLHQSDFALGLGSIRYSRIQDYASFAACRGISLDQYPAEQCIREGVFGTGVLDSCLLGFDEQEAKSTALVHLLGASLSCHSDGEIELILRYTEAHSLDLVQAEGFEDIVERTCEDLLSFPKLSALRFSVYLLDKDVQLSVDLSTLLDRAMFQMGGDCPLIDAVLRYASRHDLDPCIDDRLFNKAVSFLVSLSGNKRLEAA